MPRVACTAGCMCVQARLDRMVQSTEYSIVFVDASQSQYLGCVIPVPCVAYRPGYLLEREELGTVLPLRMRYSIASTITYRKSRNKPVQQGRPNSGVNFARSSTELGWLSIDRTVYGVLVQEPELKRSMAPWLLGPPSDWRYCS